MGFQLPSFQNLRENLSAKDVIFSGIPTVPTYTGMLNEVLPTWLLAHKSLLFGLGFMVFVLVLSLMYIYNNEANKRSLAQILATGYFQNFSGKLYFLLTQNQPLSFLLPQQETLSIHPSQVTVQIHLPASLEALRQQTADINANTQIAYIDSQPFNEPFWVRVQVKEGAIIIVEIPRTLFSLPKYLSEAYSQAMSVKMHRAFNQRFKQLIQDNANIIPAQRFIVIEGN